MTILVRLIERYSLRLQLGYERKVIMKIKQGQTYWLSILYEPDTLSDYPEQYVSAVHRCFITKVKGNTVYYTVDNNQYYLCGIRNKFYGFSKSKKLAEDSFVSTTYRRAYNKAKELIAPYV